MSGRRRDEEGDRAARFVWSDGDVIPLNRDEMVDIPGIDPHTGMPADRDWPPPQYGSISDSGLADWAEMALERETAGPETADAAEAWLSDPANWLRASERAALLAAFDGSGVHRWRPVADLLRAGPPSARMASIIADLMEHNGFLPTAKLSRTENADSDAREKALWIRWRVRELLLQAYPDVGETKAVRRATRVAGILLERTAPGISKMIRAEKDAPRRPLADLRLSVEQGPCLPDE